MGNMVHYDAADHQLKLIAAIKRASLLVNNCRKAEQVVIRIALFTVTLHVAFAPLPSFAVQVMVAVPAPTALSLPFLSTVATFVLLDFQLTDLLAALEGETVALKVPDFPTFQLIAEVFSLMLLTGW